MNFFETVAGFDFGEAVSRYMNETAPAMLTAMNRIATAMEGKAETKPVNVVTGMENTLTFDFIIQYISEVETAEWECISNCNRLRALWTSYCIMVRMDVDTDQYNDLMYRMWDAVIQTMDIAGSNNTFADESCFYDWMSEDLL